MSNLRFASEAPRDLSESLTPQEKEVLERAVGKIVMLGDQVGVSTDDMILLLQSGFTVRELLDYLLSRGGDAT